MNLFYAALSIILIQTIYFTAALEQDGSVIIKLEHALNLGPIPVYTERGNVTIHSLRVKQAIVKQNPLTEEEKFQINALSEANELYRLQSTVISNNNEERVFISAIKACMLAESELDDKLSVSLDYIGRVIGVTSLIASKATCEGASVSLDKLNEFTTTVYVRHTETGPIPDTVSYIQKIERERDAREKGGDVKDNKSFLAKYWMYIVPVVIVMVISSASNPEAHGGGGGGGGQ